ncbi:Septum formation protein Maf [hydrothermal vent metagenome]|uniref:Septum formation protein Maf n=1 Tax=hydrothermal vent metagenome TaxID=652676 RepID=A0A3B1DJG1_9ZZZZ
MPRLFLASTSPRRKLLLEQAGIPFEFTDPAIDDGVLVPGEVTPEQWVASLAFLKASAGIEGLPARDPDEHWLVLGADTLVVQDGELIGQPRDADHAREIIELLACNSHQVHTGVAILDPRKGDRHMFVDSARVTVGDIPGREINAYVNSGNWRGKAGAYNLHERLDAGWPITFTGDPTTIVGLPMQRLVRLLTRLGVKASDPDATILNNSGTSL